MAAGLGALRSLRLAMTSGSSRFCQCLADILPVLSLDSVGHHSTPDHALTWVCSSENDFTCMVVKAMTQMLGLICVVQYTFAATALEILGRQNAPGFVDLSDMDLLIFAGSWEMVPIWFPFHILVTPCTNPWCQVTFPDAAMSLLQILLNADGITMARENLQKAPVFRTMPHSWACWNSSYCRNAKKIATATCMRQAHPAAAIIFVAYYAIAVLVVVNLVTAWRAKFTVYRLPVYCSRHYLSKRHSGWTRSDSAAMRIAANWRVQHRFLPRLMIEFYRASLAENVERCEARRSELTRQVQARGPCFDAKRDVKRMHATCIDKIDFVSFAFATENDFMLVEGLLLFNKMFSYLVCGV